MNKPERYELYKYQVDPGWWFLLDKYLARALAIDPKCEIYLKEKFATLRLRITSEIHDDHVFRDLDVEAERECVCTCEYCGKTGATRRNRSYLQMLCDSCAKLNSKQANQICQATEQRWL